MADVNEVPISESAGADTAEPTPSSEPKDPFAGFQTEAFHDGETAPAPRKPAGGASGADEGDEPGEGGDGAQAGTEAGTEGTEGGAPRKQTAQERINELTRARREEERRRVAAEREIERLRALVKEPEAPAAPPKAEGEPAAPPKAEPAASGLKEPKPDDFDYGEIDPRYIRALAQYEAQRVLQESRAQAEREQAETRAQEEQRAARQRFEERARASAEKYPDFHEKVMEGAQRGEWPLSADLGRLIADSDVGAEIAYHLATNPDEAVRVYQSSPLEQARYFGRMEAKFSAAGPAATGATPEQDSPAKTPRAPAPVLPARGAGGQFQGTASSEDFSAFEKVANGVK